MKIFFIIFLFLVPLFSFGFSIQEKQSPINSPKIFSDTTHSAFQDTLIVGKSDVDTLVTYSAKDSISYSMRTRNMILYGKSDIKYRAIELKADRVTVNWDTSNLTAEGSLDKTDTTGTKIIGSPQLKDGGEEFKGARINYNFRTKKGKITSGQTEIEDGYYHGEHIKKIDVDVLYVADGRYTTCELDKPHFYFFSPKMKVIMKEVVIAEPVYLYIADVPVFALPFGVFPNRSGRRSGIIAPSYGEDARYGRYISHFGYYWAISDYLDLSNTIDWYTRGGWVNNTLLRYALRYQFNGSLSGSITQRYQGEEGDPDRSESRDYNVQVNHYQTIDPTANLSVNFTFSSGTYYRNYSRKIEDILRQNVVSNASFTKNWTESNRSLSIALRRDLSLVTDDVDELLPSLTFTQGTFFPFRKKSKSGYLNPDDQKWYEQIGISYNAAGSNQSSRTSRLIDSIRTESGQISQVKEFNRISTQSILQNVSLSFAPKMGHFNLSPFFSFRDERTYGEERTPRRNRADSTVVFDVRDLKTGKGFLSTGLSSGTRFYGIAQPQVFGVTAFRHTVNPNLSLTYGKQVYGKDPSPYSLSSNLSVQNLFEIKYQPSDTAQENKIQLLNLGMNLSYDFTRSDQPLSELFLSYRTDIGRNLSLSASTSHNFYEFDNAVGRRVNRFLIFEKGYLADLTNFNISLSTSLSGVRKSTGGDSSIPEKVKEEQERVSQPHSNLLPTQPGTVGYEDATSDFSTPWNVGLNFNYSESRTDPRSVSRTASVSVNFSFSLTEKWKISTNGNYDFVQKRFAAPTINVSRDLHCWVMDFSWFPVGFYRGYRLELRVKAPQLQDLKITKQDSERGVYF